MRLHLRSRAVRSAQGAANPSGDRWPCDSPPPRRSPLDPLPAGHRPLGVALSGGGVRATLTGLGTLRLLSDVGRLGDIRHLTSVSGGSIAAGLTALRWGELRASGFTSEAFDELVAGPLIGLLSSRSIQRDLIRRSWQTVSPRLSRTQLLADRLAASILGDASMDALSPGTWFEINAANLTTGSRFRFTQDLIGDYISGSIPSVEYPVRVADAVAFSCAVPGPFNTSTLRNIALPCQAEVGPPELVDGGVYDNLGSDALKVRPEMPELFCIVVNAGGTFDPNPGLRRLPLAGDLWRANAVLYQQVASVRSRSLFERFTSDTADTLDGCIFTLRSLYPSSVPTNNVAGLGEFAKLNLSESDFGIRELANYPTTLNRIDPETANRLFYRGWWLAGATLCAYAPEVMSSIPEFRAPQLSMKLQS